MKALVSSQVDWPRVIFFITAIFYFASFIIRLLDGASYSGTRFCNLGKVKLNRYPPVLKSLNQCTVLRAKFFWNRVITRFPLTGPQPYTPSGIPWNPPTLLSQPVSSYGVCLPLLLDRGYVLTSFSLRFEFTNYVLRRALCVNSLTFRQTQFVRRKRYT